MLKATTSLKKIAALKKRIRVIQGGQGASKTWSILTLLINYAAANENKEIIIVSEELTKMRLTVIKDFVKVMQLIGIFDSSRFIAGTLYRFPNGSFIKFIGLDKKDVGKGLRSDVAFFNEINKIDYESYRQIASRAKQIYCDFNPDAEFFVHDDIIPREDCDFLTLTYKDNELLSVEEVREIESYKVKGFNPDGTEKNRFFANLWRVYGLGQVGHIEGVVFENWTTGEFDDSLPYYYGLDFGFVNDPDSCVRVALDNKRMKVYIEEVFYVEGQTIDQLAERVQMLDSQIIADSAEERLINHLRQKTNKPIRSVKKAPGSVMQGIRLMQNYELIITPNSSNVIKELRNYKWNDKSKVAPIDQFNHAMDAIRYVIWTYSRKTNINVIDHKTTREARGAESGFAAIEW